MLRYQYVVSSPSLSFVVQNRSSAFWLLSRIFLVQSAPADAVFPSKAVLSLFPPPYQPLSVLVLRVKSDFDFVALQGSLSATS